MDRKKLLGIKRLALEGATEGERAAAQSFLDKYGDIELEEENLVWVYFSYQTGWQKNLAVAIVYHYGYKPFRGRKNQTRAEVPEYMAEFLQSIYREHRKILRRKMSVLGVAYAQEAFPPTSQEQVSSKSVELNPDDRNIFNAGKESGKENRPLKAITAGG